jgi:hypothetical protein
MLIWSGIIGLITDNSGTGLILFREKMRITAGKTANNSEGMAIPACAIPRICAPEEALLADNSLQKTARTAGHLRLPDLRCASGRYVAPSEEFAGFP